MISCLTGALLACVLQDQLGPVERELLHLGRHQGADGLWGKRPPGCFCLVPRVWPEAGSAADAATRSEVETQIGRLSDPEVAVRSAAERELVRVGLPAVPQLREAAAGKETEVAARCRGILDRLGRGLEASDPAVSGLVVLGFLGAGYSHLSKDEYDGVCFGTVVRRGLDGLVARQGEDGAWDAKDPVANAMAALAMSEAYGMTGSNLWKEPARKGLASVDRVVANGARHSAWKVLAARSGTLAEVWEEKADPLRGLQERLRGMEGVEALAGAVVLESWLDRLRQSPRSEALLAIDPATLDEDGLLLVATGIRAGWPSWLEPCKAWMEKLKARLRSGEGASRGCGALSLVEGLRSLAFRVMTLEAYYRYKYALCSPAWLSPLER